MGGTDRISQPPGKIAGKRKNSGLWNIATQKLPKIYFSVSKQLLRKTTSCTASFTRRVSAKKSLKSNHAFPQHFINAEVCICNDVRLHWRTRLSPHAAKITFNQTDSFWIHWIRLNLLNHIESVRITLKQSESHCKLFVLKTESKSWQRTSDFMALIVRHNLVRMVSPNLKHM